jgi:DNA-binding beta-propeller fold protein YncE
MTRCLRAVLLGAAAIGMTISAAQAEILAMVNYETKPTQAFRKEGIAIIDVDPNSVNFGKVLTDMPLPHDLHNHHIFYNKDASKAYLTVFGENALYVLDLKRNPYRINVVSVPDCEVGEDVVFSDDNTRWYLTCMGSNAVIVGDAVSDKPIQTISTPKPYPHGIAIHDGIDRILITETIKHDLTEPGETITVIEASTGKPLNSHKVSDKASPSGVAPVEIVFFPVRARRSLTLPTCSARTSGQHSGTRGRRTSMSNRFWTSRLTTAGCRSRCISTRPATVSI